MASDPVAKSGHGASGAQVLRCRTSVLELGQLIDKKYRVDRLLGQGGMGAVYEGYHTLIDRRVAIKVLLPAAASSEQGSVRFEREVRATGRIGNDHIVEVYDVGMLPDGSRYMVSEFLDGETLASRLTHGPLPPSVVAELTIQLLDGLGAAHATGIIHRDLKPENLFLVKQKAGRSDFLKIIDFGISKFEADDLSAMSMTATGTVLGTPYYLSPEQARGNRDIDHRSDLYTVGVIMYEATTGNVPLQAESFNELLFKIALETPPSLAEVAPGIDAAFSQVVARAMARAREDRFQSAQDMAQALAAWLGRQSGLAVPSAANPRDSGDISHTMTGSVPWPTNSNFGTTAVPLDGRRPGRRRRIALAALVLLGVAGVVLAFVRLQSSPDPVAPSASVVAAAPAPATSASRPIVTPAEPAAVAPGSRPLLGNGSGARDENLLEQPESTAEPEPVARTSAGGSHPPSTPRPARVSRPFTPAPPPAPPPRTEETAAPKPPAPPPPAATATGKGRRDFGY
jgi:serine/threonine protein kinase